EAFGVGDIYILAAAGACAGWDIALGGFVFSVGIALAAYIVSLTLKRTTMIAFGPPLALGFLMALWLNRPAVEMGRELCTEFSEVWASRPALLAGLLIGSLVVALVAARLARRIFAPAEPEGE
ncbi:MAG: hypothetical protein HZB38_11260, partial [Planctomycetes bacterium]|nr:hypothetical protein [Planctomycetota bacterium]